jgi:hypothetical protein
MFPVFMHVLAPTCNISSVPGLGGRNLIYKNARQCVIRCRSIAKISPLPSKHLYFDEFIVTEGSATLHDPDFSSAAH